MADWLKMGKRKKHFEFSLREDQGWVYLGNARRSSLSEKRHPQKVRTEGVGMSKPYEMFLWELNQELPYDLAIPLPGTDPRELKAEAVMHTCIPVFTEHCSPKATWKQSKSLTAGKRINKMKYIQWNSTQSSARKQVLIYATMWINLKNIMLSEISQTQKDN